MERNPSNRNFAKQRQPIKAALFPHQLGLVAKPGPPRGFYLQSQISGHLCPDTPQSLTLPLSGYVMPIYKKLILIFGAAVAESYVHTKRCCFCCRGRQPRRGFGSFSASEVILLACFFKPSSQISEIVAIYCKICITVFIVNSNALVNERATRVPMSMKEWAAPYIAVSRS
jgi:hypothetical protein